MTAGDVPLRLLIVDAVTGDALALVEQLRELGYSPEWERVDGADALFASLMRNDWDVILLEHRLAGIGAPDAMRLLQSLDKDIPVIVVSRSPSDAEIGDALAAGAHDVIPRGSWAHLAASVDRGLRDAAMRRESRRVREALDQRESYHRLLIEHSSDIVLVLNSDFTVRYESPSIEAVLGYTSDELTGTPVLQLVHPDDAPVLAGLIRLSLASGMKEGTAIYRVRHKDGSWRYLEGLARDLRDDPGVRGIIVNERDVTARVAAEAALKASEERYRRLIEAAEEGILITNADDCLVFVNEKATSMLGRSGDELLGRHPWDVAGDEARAQILAQNAARRAGQRSQYEIKLARPDGGVTWALVNAAPMMTGEGRYEGSTAAITDITKRKIAEEELAAAAAELRDKEARFRAIIERSHDFVSIMDRDGSLLYASPSMVLALGHQPESLLGKNMFELVHEEDRSRVWSAFERVAATPDGSDRLKFRVRHRDGSWRTMLCVGTNMFGEPAVRGVVVSNRDVTEHEQLAAELNQSRRLEAVGRLAGGVAHDFNNILTAIQASAEFLLEEVPPGGAASADAAEILRSAKRAAALTRQLLAFSRRQVLQPQVLDLGTVASDMEKMLTRLIGEDIVLTFTRDAQPVLVNADLAQLEQVLVNLVVNAREAMPDGGNITIDTRPVEIDAGSVRGHDALEPGPYALLAVGDNGVGMTREVMERIFEPFFTTKPNGTGLGLATVYGIVHQSGGIVYATSEPPGGTIMNVLLPRVPSGSGVPREAPPPAAAHGTETVLVVEDEDAVRHLVRRSLEKLGYHALVAANPAEALALAASFHGAIDLLLTDVVMPGGGGRDLARKITLVRPLMRVLYMSGYTAENVSRQGVLEQGLVLLEKPFSTESLARKVREALAGTVHV